MSLQRSGKKTMTNDLSHTCNQDMPGKRPKVYTFVPGQHIICDGHRRWFEGCTEIARAALRGIAELNEYGD